ncbi:MAG: thiamine pyrophosphate-dependent dehydrogenase E1 component subunit alpha [Armatimonadota bacterium]|nr:thiamine pyrophosphate-dependent dehydrogenase E1 component subunit alpha [Armatimonadota bacterium]MDR7401510.1 thiamine pyrophosphate-dependent dehydrogenase E1 component subunit alpha [Armatimonadota bacterium]MDR7404359.1 thiamine pyrophosphate-dependent dehydrogenase E1 component subunit alpha [Armatimonadota bacterium]MDR7437549.1 thiamine pyrophosphate-dependent dehydrogenase E1 component subunit alpha [Armatimonadota bacterium]MDR7471682.1 thiamine pyrophosphate-dependent dehydrogena
MSVRDTRAAVDARHRTLGLSDQDVLDMYYYIALARALDERMWVLQRAGKAMFVISGPGHEGCQVGAMWPMDKQRDWFVPFYRSIAACLVKGMSPTEILLGLLARAPDPSSGGRQMPGHYGHPRYKILSTSSPVGTQYPHAVGIAYAAKLRRTGEITMVAVGDGGTSEGDWHEALNWAGVHRLPVIFVVENNFYAISVPFHKQVAGGSVAARAAGYGMPGVVADGSDVLECYRVAREAYERARRGEGPTLIEYRVQRLGSHSSDDQQERYRPKDEIEAARRQDPLVTFREYLEQVGVLTDERLRAIQERVRREVDEATDAAERAPLPEPESAARYVYAPPQDDPVFWTGVTPPGAWRGSPDFPWLRREE